MTYNKHFDTIYNDNLIQVHSFMNCYKNGLESIKESDFANINEYKEFIMPINFDVGFLKLNIYDEEYRYYIGKCHIINNYNTNMIVDLIPLIIGLNGKHLKRITNMANCEFIWYDKDNKHFEIYANTINQINYAKSLLLIHIEYIHHKKNKKDV
jgi:hypothetical protein